MINVDNVEPKRMERKYFLTQILFCNGNNPIQLANMITFPKKNQCICNLSYGILSRNDRYLCFTKSYGPKTFFQSLWWYRGVLEKITQH